MAVPLKQRQQPLPIKMKKPAKAATVSAVKVVVMASVVMAVVVDAMAAVVNARKVRKAKSAHPAKAVAAQMAAVRAVLKGAMNCAKAKLALHVVNALSVVNAPSVLLVTVLPVKAVAMVGARTATTTEMKAAAMQRPN